MSRFGTVVTFAFSSADEIGFLEAWIGFCPCMCGGVYILLDILKGGAGSVSGEVLSSSEGFFQLHAVVVVIGGAKLIPRSQICESGCKHRSQGANSMIGAVEMEPKEPTL